MQVTQTVWLTNPEFVDKPDYHSFSVCAPSLNMEPEGWIRVGTVHLELPSKKAVAQVVVEKLREDQRRIRVRTEEACAQIEERIQNFLSLEAPKAV